MNPLTAVLQLPRAEAAQRGVAHTPREIGQQPESWRATRALLCRERERLSAFLTRAGFGPAGEAGKNGIPAAALIGAGSSDYIGRALAPLLARRWRCEARAVASTDLLLPHFEPGLPGRRYLWISFSRSGDSPETVSVIEQALRQRPEIHHLLITCHADGKMAQAFAGRPNVSTIVLDEAVNDRGLAMTSSFTNMWIAGQSLAYLRDFPQWERTVEALAGAAEGWLPRVAAAAAEASARRPQQVCVLGDGPQRAVADETALKITELTAGKILAWPQTFLGLRHGPMAALHKATLVMALMSSDPPRRRYECDLLEELRRKQLAHHLLVWGAPAEQAEGSWNLGTDIASIPDCDRPPLDVLPGQLLALFSAMELGLRPDEPSAGGVITRVVSQFPIYEPVMEQDGI